MPDIAFRLRLLFKTRCRATYLVVYREYLVCFSLEPTIFFTFSRLKTELKHNNKEDEMEFELTAGNKPIIDFEIELHKKVEPSGKFKLLLPKYVDSTGAFETKSGKATGSFIAKIVKTGRQVGLYLT